MSADQPMTVAALIALLEQYRDECGDDAEVRLMTQQNWPFENGIRGVTSTSQMDDFEDCEDEPFDVSGGPDAGDVIYLVEGGQIGYGRKVAWETCGSEF